MGQTNGVRVNQWALQVLVGIFLNSGQPDYLFPPPTLQMLTVSRIRDMNCVSEVVFRCFGHPSSHHSLPKQFCSTTPTSRCFCFCLSNTNGHWSCSHVSPLVRRMWTEDVFSVQGVLFQENVLFCLSEGNLCSHVSCYKWMKDLRTPWAPARLPVSNGNRYWNLTGLIWICGKSAALNRKGPW